MYAWQKLLVVIFFGSLFFFVVEFVLQQALWSFLFLFGLFMSFCIGLVGRLAWEHISANESTKLHARKKADE